MLRSESFRPAMVGLLAWLCAAVAAGQAPKPAAPEPRAPVTVTVVDENGVAVEDALVTVLEPGLKPAELHTDFAGICSYTPRQQGAYGLHVEKPGFYAANASGIEPGQASVRVVLKHEQMVREEVNVVASRRESIPRRSPIGRR
jgi:hypothetical protein